MSFQLTSVAFHDGESIPFFHARDVHNWSPPLRWDGAPEDAASFVLTCEDLDARDGKTCHWIVYDIPGELTCLEQDLGGAVTVEGARQAINDFGHAGYDGPAPPLGDGRHRYRFALLALKRDALPVSPGATAADVLRAAEPFVLDRAEIVGAYQRP